jgi:hypothetical protein
MDRSPGKDVAHRDRERSCAGAMTMASLTKDLRRQLERTVAEARKIGEEGAEQSLKRLAVDVSRPHDALTPEEKKFRVRLRAHARQLGDRPDARPARLIQAVAYEHWHRLLFARFLIENDLLLHPEHGVALSLDEVKELALGENREWVQLAADYAQRMLLRSVFHPEDPALRVSLPPEKRMQLEAKLSSLPHEMFGADDGLGWVYQFWQRDEKDRVNKSEVKIGADELAPVTQLFTEDYMVEFLLHNTLGAWWAGKIGVIKAATEQEARARAALPARDGVPEISWTYLRLVQDTATNTWLPAAGTFAGWPKSASLIRLLDPCMGSGHFLVFALPLLVRLRMEEESLSARAGVVAVLKDNIYGLELDERCTQIAAFNVALTVWKLAGYQALPPLHLACSGLAPRGTEAEWTALAGENERMRRGMMRLHELFKDAPVLGSLINPSAQCGNLIEAEFHELAPILDKALTQENENDTAHEIAVTAQGLAKAAEILAGHFTLVATNVPYLGRGKQDALLRDYCERVHPQAKADLSTCFIERCLDSCAHGGSTALVTPQNWLFLTTYSKFREALLGRRQWNLVARLGPKGFQTPMWDFNVQLGIISQSKPAIAHAMAGIDVSAAKHADEKASLLRGDKPVAIAVIPQAEQLKNPDASVNFTVSPIKTYLGKWAGCYQGLTTADDGRWRRQFWEIGQVGSSWRFLQTPSQERGLFSGREDVVSRLLIETDNHTGVIRGREAWGKRGIAIDRVGSLARAVYDGDLFHSLVPVVVPHDPADINVVAAFCMSEEFIEAARIANQALSIDNGYLSKLPFDIARWQKVAAEKYPSGLPKPFSSDPTQWLFNGHPKGSNRPLQVAVARLFGYQWPRQTGSSFPDCPALCSDGLDNHAEADGIICLTSLAGKASVADRLRALLADAYGGEWSATKLAELLDTSASLELWLRDRFFEEHCELFHQRPIVWHVWDGRNEGFHALVNYHKLDHKTLEKLIYSYLGDWISRQRQDLASGVEGADGRLAAAEHLQGELKKILDGEKPYDVFVRWKSLREQLLGWNPDLNDGVRINIRPWIMEARLYRATKPGILRVNPNIKYGKDRGKEPAHDPSDFPWFKGSAERTNDIHLSLDEKRRARGMA